MNAQLLADLEAFEHEGLSDEDLRSRHGDEVDGILGIHERIRTVASAVPFDVETGWALVSARLAEPATVIPLRPRPRPRPRAVGLVAAAALMLAAGAFAAVRSHGVGERPAIPPVPSVTVASTSPGGSPRAGGHPPAGFVRGSETVEPLVPEEPGTTDGGSTGSQDSPDDIDNGSGNDGSHDDQGGGNDQGGGGQTPGASHSEH